MTEDIEKEINKAKILREALPYIKKFYKKIIVIKYGGSLMVNKKAQEEFAKDIILLKYVGMNPVIVHGGGKEISKWLDKIGKESTFIEGLRVTDSETMEVTEMVLSGKINSHLVSLLNKNGGSAIGLSGKDGNLFFGKKKETKKNKDLGFVGDIKTMDMSIIKILMENNYIPVISSVASTEDGGSLNMNADHVAESISIGLKATKLIYLTDVNGIKINKKIIGQINLKNTKELLNNPEIKGGMLPKLNCSINAIKSGVEQVHIINGQFMHSVLLEIFTDYGIGTMITNE